MTWAEAINQGGTYATDYPTGYRITGKMTANNGVGVPKIDESGYTSLTGELVVNNYFMSNDKQSIMKIVMESNNFGPFYRKSDVEYWQVTWNLDGGAWPTNGNHASQIAKDGKLRAPYSPLKTGYTFGGWYKEASLTNRVIFPYDATSVTGDFTLYAKWTAAVEQGEGTISITKQSLPGNCRYDNISLSRLEGGVWVVVNGNVSKAVGTTDITVTSGTYRVSLMGYFLTSSYWSETASFTVSAGQTRKVNISCQVCGLAL